MENEEIQTLVYLLNCISHNIQHLHLELFPYPTVSRGQIIC